MTRTDAYRERAIVVNGNCISDGKMDIWNMEREYAIYKAILKGGSWAHNINRSKLEASILENILPDVNELELLVGRPSSRFEATDEVKSVLTEGRRIRSIMGLTGGWSSNSTGHRALDWEKLLRLGIDGIIEEIDRYMSALDEYAADYRGKFAFYESSKRSLKAVAKLAERYEEYIREKAAETEDAARKAELEKIARNLSGAQRRPAEHFYEAMQAMWLFQFALQCCEGDTGLTGRLDNYLYPFYKKDIESGELTPEFAFELIEQLYYKHNELYGSCPASIMAGGVDRDGKPVWNELSYMCVRAIQTTKAVNPSANICYTPDMPDDLLDLAVDNIAKGYTRPAFFNDRIIQQGLRDAGMDERHARYYINSTCVEITPIGASNVRVATPYINLNKVIEYILGGGKQLFGEDCGIVRPVEIRDADLADFDSFLSLTKRVISEKIRSNLGWVLDFMYSQEHYAASPLASALTDDCLKRGLDSGAGGALYNYVYPCFPGFINLIDDLAAIKKAVYTDKKLTLSELSELCRTDFADAEKLRLYLMNFCPKFGNGTEESDGLGVMLYEFIRSELAKYRTSLGGTFHPSYFAWIFHGLFGKVTSATPDGRHQGEALSESLGSAQGRDKNGPLGVVESITKIDQSSGIGGIATNFRFSKKMLSTPEGRAMLKSFIKICMEKGCFEIQFNVVDQEDLIDAQKHPENHRTLLVRVAGYSDYFTALDPVIQNEIIKRSEHDSI